VTRAWQLVASALQAPSSSARTASAAAAPVEALHSGAPPPPAAWPRGGVHIAVGLLMPGSDVVVSYVCLLGLWQQRQEVAGRRAAAATECHRGLSGCVLNLGIQACDRPQRWRSASTLVVWHSVRSRRTVGLLVDEVSIRRQTQKCGRFRSCVYSRSLPVALRLSAITNSLASRAA